MIKEEFDSTLLSQRLLFLENKGKLGGNDMVYQVCKRCVMDNSSDYSISFDSGGICNYCTYALSRKSLVYYPNAIGKAKLDVIIEQVKKDGKDKEFDCLMGLSGGLDSSYLAYLGAREWGLRILAVHIDDGFNSKTAERNIENLANKLGITVVTEKPDRVEYLDMLRAFMRAGVPALAVPQDNILQAYLNLLLKKYKIRYFFSGANFALESILQRSHSHNAADSVHIRHIHSLYGTRRLLKIKTISLFERYFAQRYLHRIVTLRPLDLIEYQRDKAIAEMQEHVGFDYYGGKHYESVLTKFVQTYYLPKKFAVDKRRSHFSSLIISDQMTREHAIAELEKPLYDVNEMERDLQFILSSIGMGRLEFDLLMKQGGRQHSDYRGSLLLHLSDFARKYRKLIE